jgi:hypothetical protein
LRKLDSRGDPYHVVDTFGLVNHLKAFLRTSEDMARCTGRTTMILNNAQTGDTIVVSNSRIKSFMVDTLRRANHKIKKVKDHKKVKVVVIDPKKLDAKALMGLDETRIHFDHVWMYEHLLWRLDHLLEWPEELYNTFKPKGEDCRECPTYSYSARIWPEDTGPVRH